MNEQLVYEDLEDWRRVVTERSLSSYAEILGLQEADLWALISKRKIMDLAAGYEKFGADIALASLPGSSWEPPSEVNLIDIQYAGSNYQQQWLNAIQERIRTFESTYHLSLPKVGLHKRIQIAYNDEAAKAPLEMVKTWRKALSWNDLSSLPSDYNIIVSVFGYPYYSMMADAADLEYKELMDSKSPNVFQQIINRLAPQGVFIGLTNYSYTSWENNPRFQNELRTFFLERGCELIMKKNKKDNAIMHLIKLS